MFNLIQGNRTLIARVIKRTPFRPVHMGAYTRGLYFWQEVGRLPVEEFRNVLDAGCGAGEYALAFARRYPHVQVMGCDLQAAFLPGPYPPNVALEHRDLLNLDAQERFDFIYCIDVLEHIPHNESVLENCYRALTPGGYLYLHVPYDVPGKRVFPERWFAAFNDWAAGQHIGEQRTVEEWCSLLERQGWEIIRACWTFGFWGELAWEIDRLVQGRFLKVLLAPVLKLMARLALVTEPSRGRGNVLLVARRSNIRCVGSCAMRAGPGSM